MMVAACRNQTDVELLQVRADKAFAADRATAEPFVQTLQRQRSNADSKNAEAAEVEPASRNKPRPEQKTDKPEQVAAADETEATESGADVSDQSEVASDAVVTDPDQEVDAGLTDEDLPASAVIQQPLEVVDLSPLSQTGPGQTEAITAEPMAQAQAGSAAQTVAASQQSEPAIAAAKPVTATSQDAANHAAQSPLAVQAISAGPQVATGDSSTEDSTSQLPAQPRPAPQAPQAPQPTAAPHAASHAEQPAAPAQTATVSTVATPVTDVAAAPASATSGPAITENQQTTTQTTTSQDDSLNAARLARGLNNAVNQRGGAVTLRLTPPEMGTVRIQMQITGTQVSVRFHAETEQGQAMLAQNLGQLRQTLEGQGLHVDRISVQTMQPQQSTSSNHSSQQQDQQRSDSQQHESRADDGRSRGSFDRRQDAREGDRRQRDEQSFNFQQMLQEGNAR
ncbi:MAG: flagellar hook-length control protein FliK [Phycisphaeraceae bacterium]|nr:flagellar hook-length control protein FliK [Phycisphaeraceae bacterium]